MAERVWIGTKKGLFRAERKGRWTITRSWFLGVPVSAVLPDPRDGAVYVALNHGHFGTKVHRADDGERFAEIAVPTYPKKPEGLEDVDPYRKTPVPWSLVQLWCLEAGGRDQPGWLWAGTIPGGLFCSQDRGASWQLAESLWYGDDRRRWVGGGYDNPGIHSIVVDPRDSRRVSIGVSCGGVWHSRDAGATFALAAKGMRAAYMPEEHAFDEIAQDPHRIVACPAAPDRVWCQHHNGIFHSRDAGRTWSEVTADAPSRFGFAVAVHPRNPDTAWFVPATKDEMRIPVDGKVCVLRTTDGGKTLTALRRGLPQEHAYDLVYRHALDVDADATTLAMGSTTGSVWLSDDGGDGWQHLSAHLPPVHTVRFG